MSNKLAKIIKTEIDKQSLLKKNFEELDKVASIQRKVAFDWNKVHKAIGRFGTEFKVQNVNDKEVRIYNSTQDIVWPINIVLPVFNFYDDDGNLVSEMEND